MLVNYTPGLHQAIGLAICLLEWELEQSSIEQPPPPDWAKELEKARQQLADLHQQFEAKRQAEIERAWPDKPPEDTSKRGRQRASRQIAGIRF